ncbi:calmodulin-like isoform X3 [Saccostrea echinata]|uniref:calmodulin-like isoform X3 n=1 Tax=Saccostrea echinata TaxID=191078 RepID=UPI002A8248CD|nr:calmodulin-like isoform X3 [Saccostrea echinata]
MAAAQRKMYEDFFDKTDAMGQKDGKVSIQELKKMVVEGLGQKKSDREIAEMFSDIDKNGDGQITKEEFLCEMMKKERRTAVEEAFQKIDKNGDGKLARDEVAAAMREIGHFTDEEIDKLIKKADKNNDGVIDRAEFEKEVY